MEINCETDGEQNCDFEESEMTDKRTEINGDNKKYRCLHMQVLKKKVERKRRNRCLYTFVRACMYTYLHAYMHNFLHTKSCVCVDGRQGK